TNEDARIFAKKVKLTLFEEDDQWCAGHSDFVDVQESEVGFGSTALAALAELAKHGLVG
ncbi:unnamed protein product, partial [marine sediment metagenome]